MEIDIGLYQKYMHKYVKTAIENSNRTNSSIYEYLSEMRISGLWVKHRKEKTRALEDAKQAFDEKRHWPLEIVLSHLGLNAEELGVISK